jgi:hypothetical protein
LQGAHAVAKLLELLLLRPLPPASLELLLLTVLLVL